MTTNSTPTNSPTTNAPRSTSVPTAVRQLPLAWNGYVMVAAPAVRIPASEVRVGDILLLDGFVTRVNQVDHLQLGGSMIGGYAVWLRGDLNIIRFPTELLSVIR